MANFSSGASSNFKNANDRNIRLFDKDGDGRVSDNEAIDYILNRRTNFQPISSKLYSTNNNAKTFEVLISKTDKNYDGIFSSEEIQDSLLDLNKTTNLNNLSTKTLDTLFKNSDLEKIQASISTVDKDSDGQISDMEVLDTLLQGKSGKINVNDSFIDRLLKKNSKIVAITDLIDELKLGQDGNIGDEDIYKIFMRMRAGGINIDQAGITLFLNKNPNSSKIEATVKAFDKQADGVLTDTEMNNILIDLRNGKLKEADHSIVLEKVLSKNPNFVNIRDFISAVDIDANGQINDAEIAKAIFKLNRKELSSPQNVIDLVFANNSNTEKIKAMINSLDPDKNGLLNDQEVIKVSLASLKADNSQKTVLETVLNASGSPKKYMDAIKQIDKDLNGEVTNQETIDYLLATRANKITSVDPELSPMILATNSKYPEISTALTNIDINNDGTISDSEVLNTIIKSRKGQLNINNEIMLGIINTNNNTGAITSVINELDKDNNGQISDKELAEGLFSYRTDALKPEYKIAKTDFAKTLADELLKQNNQFNNLTAAYDKLATDSKGNVALMLNTLIEQKAGEINNANYQPLIEPLKDKLDSWLQTRKTTTTAKLEKMFTHINGMIQNQPRAGRDLTQKSNDLDTTKALKAAKEKTVSDTDKLVTNYQAQLNNPPTKVETYKDEKGQTQTRTVVDVAEVAKIQNNLNVSKATLAQAQIELQTAKNQATKAVEDAYASLTITPAQRNMMQSLSDRADTIAVDLDGKKNKSYTNLEKFIDDYYGLASELPANYANLLGKLFYVELGQDVQLLKGKLF